MDYCQASACALVWPAYGVFETRVVSADARPNWREQDEPIDWRGQLAKEFTQKNAVDRMRHKKVDDSCF